MGYRRLPDSKLIDACPVTPQESEEFHATQMQESPAQCHRADKGLLLQTLVYIAQATIPAMWRALLSTWRVERS